MDELEQSSSSSSSLSSFRRPRAGTLPSSFLLGGGSEAVAGGSQRLAASSGSDPAAFHGASLLGAGLHTRPDSLRRRLSGLPLNGTSSAAGLAGSPLGPSVSISDHAASVHRGLASDDAERSSAAAAALLLRQNQPLTPDPVASARLRSGSLTLPASGLGSSFTPGAYGPPGSWTPRTSSALNTPMAMPVSNPMIPEESKSVANNDTAPTAEEEQASVSLSKGIVDFLNLDDTSETPADDRTPTKINHGLLAPGSRPSGSISVPSSAYPSISNLRQSYQDHSASIMQTSASSSSDLAAPSSLSPATVAARLRANTMAAADPLFRKTSPFHQSHPPNGESYAPTGRSLADLALDQNLNQSTVYDAPGPSSSTYLLATLNRPRASTIGILDEAALQAQQQRKRAGTSVLPPSNLRASLYDETVDHNGENMQPYPETAGIDSGLQPSVEVWPRNGSDEVGQTHSYYGYRDAAQIHVPIGHGASTDQSGSPPPQQASRSLWIGNIDADITSQDLMLDFGQYGPIESVRLLPDKDCAFVNFVSIYDAVKAKEDVLNRMGGQIRTLSGRTIVVRIGFGKADSAPATPATGFLRTFANQPHYPGHPPTSSVGGAMMSNEPHLQTAPTRALWIGSIPPTTTHIDLLKVFSPFGAIESARVLVHKQCGFVNFENLDDAVKAREALNGQDLLGSEVGPVKIGYAKVPNKPPGTPTPDQQMNPAVAYASLKRLSGATAVPLEEQISTGNLENYRSPMQLSLAANALDGVGPRPANALTQSLQPVVGLSPNTVAAELGNGAISPGSMVTASVSEQQVLMRELGGNPEETELHVQAISASRQPANYFSSIPKVADDQHFPKGRNLDSPRLRDIRKRLEAPAPQVSQAEVDALTNDLLEDVVVLSSDYIGNVIVQKLFERCSAGLRFAMLERIAPYLASIACHKNGTWAAQKVIDVISSQQEIDLVCQHMQPYVPALLLDQFGNYAAQLCLQFQSPASDFFFDAMVDRTWEIASGRFGARSMRTVLEHPNTTRLQQKRVAISLILNSVLLATNPNGALLLTWLLDTSNLPGRYRLLATRLAPHLPQLCPHKVASTTILKIVNQRVDPASAKSLVDAIVKPSDSTMLEDILSEQVHGSTFVCKLLQSGNLDPAEKAAGGAKVREILLKNPPHHSPAYAKLCMDVGVPPTKYAGLQAPAKFPHRGLPGIPFPQANGPVPPLSMPSGNPMSPPFQFPAFGSPMSPQQHPSRAMSPGFSYDPYGQAYAMAPSPARNELGKDGQSPSPNPGMAGHPHHPNFAEQYMHNVPMHMTAFNPYAGAAGMSPVRHPLGSPYSRMNDASPTYPYNHHAGPA